MIAIVYLLGIVIVIVTSVAWAGLLDREIARRETSGAYRLPSARWHRRRRAAIRREYRRALRRAS